MLHRVDPVHLRRALQLPLHPVPEMLEAAPAHRVTADCEAQGHEEGDVEEEIRVRRICTASW
jgi:hypothetical protein